MRTRQNLCLTERMMMVKSRRNRLPRLVTVEWIEQSWREKTLLDEERKPAQNN